MTPPKARNAIREALTGILDPQPTKPEIAAMWEHFDHKCAFCRRPLNPAKPKDKTDYLIAKSCGGRNHLFNRVLSCAKCRGGHSLKYPWEDLLERVRCFDDEDIDTRKKRIEEWQQLHRDHQGVQESQIAEALREADKVIAAFHQACDSVRALRPKSPFRR